MSRSVERHCSFCVFTLVSARFRSFRPHKIYIYIYVYIQEFTGGFSEANLVGEGGFEWVYCGVLPSGEDASSEATGRFRAL